MSTYLKFWNLQRSAFKAQAGSEDFFRTPQLDALMKRISYFCEHGEPLILITGKRGMGKTLLADKIQTELSVDTVDVAEVNLHAPVHESGWLINKLAKFFNQSVKSNSEAEPQANADMLLRCFADLHQENRKLVVVVDDAQFVQGPRALSDLEQLMKIHARARNSFSLVILAEPDFQDTIQTSSLAEYITLSAALLTWGRTDIEEFIRYRSRNAGLGEQVFLTEALKVIERASGGNPARITTILEHCLMEAFIQATKVVSESVALQAASYLKREDYVETVAVEEEEDSVPQHIPTSPRISFADLMRKKV